MVQNSTKHKNKIQKDNPKLKFTEPVLDTTCVELYINTLDT